METVPPINVRFDPDGRAWIKRMAHALNWSENKVIRECVQHTRMALEHPDSPEVARIIQLLKAIPQGQTTKTL
jgi:hypothetical protein